MSKDHEMTDVQALILRNQMLIMKSLNGKNGIYSDTQIEKTDKFLDESSILNTAPITATRGD